MYIVQRREHRPLMTRLVVSEISKRSMFRAWAVCKSQCLKKIQDDNEASMWQSVLSEDTTRSQSVAYVSSTAQGIFVI